MLQLSEDTIRFIIRNLLQIIKHFPRSPRLPELPHIFLSAAQNIADDIEMHVSTVSRAVKGKYIQYPGGTIGMRDIFNNTQTFGDQDSTTEEIKEEIRRLVKEEDKKKPLSDSKIVSLLEQKNMKISRRTVAKYRAQLGIAGTTQRKIHE